MDNRFEQYHERIVEAIRTGEVVCLFFPRLGKTLILDFRETIEIPPAVILDGMVASPQERLERLQELRPGLTLPEEVRLAPWIGFVRSLHDMGVYDVMIERCSRTAHPSLVEDCRDAVRMLERLEKQLIRSLIRGEMTRTIWQRSSSA